MIYKPLVKYTNIYLIKVNKIKLKCFLFLWGSQYIYIANEKRGHYFLLPCKEQYGYLDTDIGSPLYVSRFDLDIFLSY